MHAVELISISLPDGECEPLPCEAQHGICAVTGSDGPCVPRANLLGKSFTNADRLAAPQSNMVGVMAWRALTHKWERASSWYCDGNSFVRLDRKAVRQKVLSGEYPDRWAGYVTTSYKKHGSLWAKVNNSSLRIWRFETLDVDCSDHSRLTEMWRRLDAERRNGIGRTTIETLDCNPYALKAIGLARWMEFEKWARPIHQSALYRFLCYLLPSQEEIEAG